MTNKFTFATNGIGYNSDEDFLGGPLIIKAIEGGPAALGFHSFLHFRGDKEEVIQKAVQELGCRIVRRRLDIDDKTGEVGLFDDHILFFSDECGGELSVEEKNEGTFSIDVRGWSTNRESVQKMVDYLKTIYIEPVPDPPEPERGTVHALVFIPMKGIAIRQIGFAGIDFDRGNYEPDVVEAFDFVQKDIVSAHPSGRLTVFSGPPGTGKTHMVRSLLKKGAVDFVLIDPSSIDQLQGPQLLPVLLDHKNNVGKPLVLVLEDGDKAIESRKKESSNVGLVTSLLNLSDGILGSVVDIRILVTSNLPETSIDPAAMRDGRLSKHIVVGPLQRDTATGVLRRLLPGKNLQAKGSMTLAEVYKMARGAGWVPEEKP